MSDGIKGSSGYWVNPRSGQMVAPEIVLQAMEDMQVVLVGEIHDRLDIHLWQLHVAELLVKAGKPVMMGFEMFPRSSQPALDNFVAGNISVEVFLEQSNWEKVWGFEASLYMPLFLFCRAHRIPMVALNCYRALVSRVGKDGWETVPEDERDGLTPAKPASPTAREYLFEMTGGQREGRAAQTADDVAFDRFVRAQGVWDRAFACNIANAIRANPEVNRPTFAGG